tara:strand:- start:752 stop:1792 length:1041 start_codon:yes stop_codon:yes gene_type:complete
MFENYPKIEYDFINEDGTFTKEMQDIFRRVTLTEETMKNGANYKLYTINDGDTPERIAFEAYDDASFWWVVLLVNNILDKENEWPKSVTDLTRLFDDFLDGYSYYTMETLDIQKDDIVVKRDSDAEGSIDINVYGVIDSYDSFLHKFDVKNQKASETKLNANDEFYIYRRNGDEYEKIDGFGYTACARQSIGSTGCVQILGPTADTGPGGNGITAPYCATAGSTFGMVRKRTPIKNGVDFFEYKNDPVNPYSVPNGAGASGDFYLSIGQNLCGYTSCILYKYITDESIEPYIRTISKGANLIRGNDDKRVIKLVKPSILREIVKEFGILISGNVPPGTTKYITLNG